MGNPVGFIQHGRELPQRRSVTERLQDFREVYLPFAEEKVVRQASRCMDCGVPFCQAGCPLGNAIPDWNHLVYEDDWRAAFERLRATNNFPEFTGRICPAPCESACVLGITSLAVTIEQIEREIVERAYAEGWVVPTPPQHRTGKSVAVVGSGPAGLACADQLNRAGHFVTVFERAAKVGGLLRYGIPDFKLEKHVLDRRLTLMEDEGVTFRPGAEIGADESAELLKEFDAVVLCIGSTRPRDVEVPGRNLDGIHYAMDFLKQQNERVSGERPADDVPISARGRDVLVIGGGDTASDCIGTANRQGARSVTSFEILPSPPDARAATNPWPFYANVFRVSSSHEEGCERTWSVLTKSFEEKDGRVCEARTVDVEFVPGSGRPVLNEIEGSEKSWKTDLVLLAIGYGGPEASGLAAGLGVAIDSRGNLDTDGKYATGRPGIFAAGDARRGQSLVVWAISEGREAAREVDAYLMGATALPSKGAGDLPRS